MKEIKFRVNQLEELLSKITRLGGRPIDEKQVIDTYYKQPDGLVLKVYDDNTGSHFVKLKSKDGGFDILEKRDFENPEDEKRKLEKKFGILKVLNKKKRRFFVRGNKMYVNSIENLGDFAIIFYENEHPRKLIVDLDLANNEVITVAFSSL